MYIQINQSQRNVLYVLFSCRLSPIWKTLPISILLAETLSLKSFYMPIF